MNNRYIMFAFVATTALHGMDNTFVPLEEEKDQSPAVVAMSPKLAELTEKEWKEKADGSTLDLSQMEFDSVAGLSDICKPSPSSAVPPLFPYKTLTKIILAHNILQEVNGKDFVGFENLRHLDLSHNKLKSVDIGSFFGACPKLKNLNLSHNEIDTVAWSPHGVWHKVGMNATSFPIINCVSNNIAPVDRDWLKEKYREEHVRFIKSIEMNAGLMWGSGIGTLAGGMSAGLAAVGTKCVTPYVAFGLPVGCVGGALIGAGIIVCNANTRGGEVVQKRLYFEQQDIPERIESDRELNIYSCGQYRC